MKFQPIGERILVERLEEDTKTVSGIIIPDNAKEKPLTGVIKAISECFGEECCESKDKKPKKIPFKNGDKVVFGKYSGTEIKLDGKEYLILKLEDVLGILK